MNNKTFGTVNKFVDAVPNGLLYRSLLQLNLSDKDFDDILTRNRNLMNEKEKYLYDTVKEIWTNKK